MRVGYLGPEGTFSHEAVVSAGTFTLVPLPTLHAAVRAVHDGEVDRALVPIENSREGSVNPTLDALAFATDDVEIVGELVHPVHHCLVARAPVELSAVRTVLSHPQASAQCARFLRSELPGAQVVAAASTAEAVRALGSNPLVEAPAAALGTRLAAELYGGVVLRADVEDDHANETRFVWVAPAGTPEEGFRPPVAGNPTRRPSGDVTYKTALFFWGAGSAGPGWLVRCLSEFASRGVNLTRIESRPRRQGLGEYMFFLDLEGSVREPQVAEAVERLRTHADVVRVLGSFPAA